jgi:hypothetical protein
LPKIGAVPKNTVESSVKIVPRLAVGDNRREAVARFAPSASLVAWLTSGFPRLQATDDVFREVGVKECTFPP